MVGKVLKSKFPDDGQSPVLLAGHSNDGNSAMLILLHEIRP